MVKKNYNLFTYIHLCLKKYTSCVIHITPTAYRFSVTILIWKEPEFFPFFFFLLPFMLVVIYVFVCDSTKGPQSEMTCHYLFSA